MVVCIDSKKHGISVPYIPCPWQGECSTDRLGQGLYKSSGKAWVKPPQGAQVLPVGIKPHYILVVVTGHPGTSRTRPKKVAELAVPVVSLEIPVQKREK